MQKRVTVIVPHHLNENQRYLDLTLDSLLKSTHKETQIICVADTPNVPRVPEGVRLIHRPQWNTASKKVNEVMRMTADETDYFMFVSDDVIVSKRCISELVDSLGLYPLILGVKSNSDCTTRYISPIELINQKGELKEFGPDCEYEDLNGFYDSVLDYSKANRCLIPQPWVSFYCVMIPKWVWNWVGDLDEALDSRHNDEDYCYRAKQKQIHSMIAMNAFAFHFGSKTLKISASSREQEQASKHFIDKWSKTHV